jgi:hypothetical protein
VTARWRRVIGVAPQAGTAPDAAPAQGTDQAQGLDLTRGSGQEWGVGQARAAGQAWRAGPARNAVAAPGNWQVRAAGLSSAAIGALQAALAAEHAAAYGYGVAGAHLSGRRQQHALADWNAHRARRDQLTAMLAAQGAVPVAAAAAYQLPFPVTSPHSAATLAAALEDGVTRAYLGIVALPVEDLRTYGAMAMQDSAVRAARWRGATVAFPGLPPGALARRHPPAAGGTTPS